MAALRAVFAAVVVGVFLAMASTVAATPLDDCAQRVIRDWYSGGRVDGVYPLPCYRAALRALPADILQYSDADRDITSALAYARQKRHDAARAAAAPETKESTMAAARPRSTDAARPATKAKTRREPASAAPSRAPRPIDPPVKLASAPAPTGVDSSVPYPIVGLAALSTALLLSGAAGWIARRRRGPGHDPDR